MGAAFAVLQKHAQASQAEAQPLELQAAKCRMLHTEPAAGAVGLTSLANRLRAGLSPLMMRLLTLNPHVDSIMQACTSARLVFA